MQTDADLMVLARAGDRGALGAIYDRYADRLYDLCSSVLRDPDVAFDAMVDTFVLAALELYRLRRLDRLEAWLFAMAREQLLARTIPIGVDEHADFDAEQAAAATVGAGAIVWEAVSWLPPRDRILLDLHVRQSLDNKGLAAAIGVSLPHAAALVRDLDERVERLMSALLVARLSRPGCSALQRLIAGEDEAHPDEWLRRVAMHVDVCRTCLLWRENQPSAIQLIREVPRESAPPEVRDEILDRVDLLWAELGPPDWRASIEVGGQPADLPAVDVTEPPPPPPPPEPADTVAVGDASAGPHEDVQPETNEDTDGAVVIADGTGDMTGDAESYDADQYDELEELQDVESILPPPPRLRRSGFPRRSMYPGRRRRTRAAVLLVAGLVSAAVFLNYRGVGSDSDRLYAAEARAAAGDAPVTAPTTAPVTAPPTTAQGPDIRGPFVFNLVTVHGCIGPNTPTTTALASVADDRGRPASVELVFTDASGAATPRQMTRRAGNEYEGTIGPYAVDGNISWAVTGTDAAGNSNTGTGQAVGASPAC